MPKLFSEWMRHTYHKEYLERCKGANNDRIPADQYPRICDMGMFDIFYMSEFKRQTYPGTRSDPDSTHAFLPALILYLEDGGYFGDFRLLCSVLKRKDTGAEEYCPARIGPANATSLEYFSLHNMSVQITSTQMRQLSKVGYTTGVDRKGQKAY